MKSALLISSALLGISLLSGCQKGEVASLPVISTSALTDITGISVTSGGTITSDGGSAVISRGISWSTTPDQMAEVNKTTDGGGTGNFTSNISGLNGSTTYFVRAYATNSTGTAYGNELSFETRIGDIDGNSYHSVKIGTQTWMVENLKVTHLNDGSDINNISSNLEWTTSKAPAYCWYYNIVPVDGFNGPLYNYYTVNTGKLCPAGWKVPSDGDWKTLEMFLGMSQTDADMINWRGEGISSKMKAVDGWYVLNGIQDQYGFKAMPAGSRYGASGDYQDYNVAASWWSSTGYDDATAWFRSIVVGETTIYRGNLQTQSGFSVRCMMNY